MELYNFLLLFIFFKINEASQVLRPRGVSLEKAVLYNPNSDFYCFDGSGKIPFKYVNDDYCDCQDGSDEPGTAACPNGTFFCNNSGHSPLIVPSSRVNDGICDCCDASDEYGTNSDCTDVCLELGRAAREESIRLQEEQQRGFQIKQQMIIDAQAKKKEKQVKLEELQGLEEEAKSIRDIKEEFKKSAEEPENIALESYRKQEEEEKERQDAARRVIEEEEAQESFQMLDSNDDGLLSVDEIQEHLSFDTNKDGEVSVDEATFYLQQEETMDWEKFLKSGWQLMRPVYLYNKNVFTPPTTDTPPSDEMVPPPPPTEDEQEEQQDGDELPEEDLEEEELSEEEYDENEDEEEEEEEELHEPEDEVAKEEEVKPPRYDEETQLLVDAANAARNEFNEAERKLKDIQKEIQDINTSLAKDYGPNDEFRVMEGQCYDYNDREYTYTLCPFDKAVQKSKNGHGEVRLGQWGDWLGEGDKYSAMKYTGGQGCWNGPQRTAEVRLTCGTDNELTAVSEPNRCEYLYQFTTPAACVQILQDEHIHTEL